MNIYESEFFKYGKLPNVCIHSLSEDQYSKHYIPQERCDCGCEEWIEGKMKIIEDMGDYVYPLKDVHRCKECNEVRVAYRKYD